MNLEKIINEAKSKRTRFIKESILSKLSFAIFALSVYFLASKYLETSVALLITTAILFPTAISFIFISSVFYDKYNDFYKENFINTIVSDMGFSYEKEFTLYDRDIEKLFFINTLSNGHDKISGSYKNVNFNLFETNTQDSNKTSIYTIFSCEFYKNFKTKTLISNKKLYYLGYKSIKAFRQCIF